MATSFSFDSAVIIAYASSVAWKVLGALALWIIGRWLIGFTVNQLRKALNNRKVDPTLTRYGLSILNITLNILLVIGILGYFGIQTTTFAALFAAAGVAIGLAWSGLLANLAAGVFLIILRPFKVGDFISAGGVTGTVTEIGLFATTVDTPDNINTIIGNNKILSDNIQNFSANQYRRVDLQAQLSASTDPKAAAALLRDAISQIPNVLQTPVVDIEVIELNLMGTVIAVRPYTHNDNYWQVYFDTNYTIQKVLGEAGFTAPAPTQNIVVQQSPQS
jgi:small conductance mechanosensitive channel